jgi:hypothetical protein
MTRSTIVPALLVLVGAWAALAAGIMAVWLTAEARVFALVILPAAVVAGLMVLYFDWRAALRRRMFEDQKDDGLDEAA